MAPCKPQPYWPPCLPRSQPLFLHPASSACSSLYRAATGSPQTQSSISCFLPSTGLHAVPAPLPVPRHPSPGGCKCHSGSNLQLLSLQSSTPPPRPLLTCITYSQPIIYASPQAPPDLHHLLSASSLPQPYPGPQCHLAPWPHPAPTSASTPAHVSLLPEVTPRLPWHPAPGEPQPLGPAPGRRVRVCSI